MLTACWHRGRRPTATGSPWRASFRAKGSCEWCSLLSRHSTTKGGVNKSANGPFGSSRSAVGSTAASRSGTWRRDDTPQRQWLVQKITHTRHVSPEAGATRFAPTRPPTAKADSHRMPSWLFSTRARSKREGGEGESRLRLVCSPPVSQTSPTKTFSFVTCCGWRSRLHHLSPAATVAQLPTNPLLSSGHGQHADTPLYQICQEVLQIGQADGLHEVTVAPGLLRAGAVAVLAPTG